MSDSRASRWGAWLVLASAACTANPEQPETPAFLRDVAMVTPQGDFSHPHIPPLRTTADGRVGIAVEGGSAELRFYLLAPEKLDRPVVEGPAGAAILADTNPFAGGIHHSPNGHGIGHNTLCDVRGELVEPPRRPNPYPCDSDPSRDCYDVVHMGFESGSNPSRLWGTPVHVEVSSPKTAAAQIADIQLGEPVAGPPLPGPVWFEPMVTWDGRLLTGRRLDTAALLYEWTNPETGQKLTRAYDLMYSLVDDAADACDVTAWRDFNPVSHAHHDPRVRGRYGFAEFQLRDGEGNLVADGEDMGVSYPWLDRAGKNLFMTAVSDTIEGMAPGMYPYRCVETCDDRWLFEPGVVRGHAVAGLWTYGKMVHIDTLVNSSDWATPIDPRNHILVQMFHEPDGTPVEVRVGGARTVGRHEDPTLPPGWSGNTNVLDSIENLFNFHAQMRTVTPRDIVWTLSNGHATDEFAFDDYLDPDAFIVSSMIASVVADPMSGLVHYPYYKNGYPLLPISLPPEDVHLQNAATPLPDRWRVPAYGRVAVGTGRAESNALGGVTGRGFWLSGTNRVEYEVPEQPQDIRAKSWYVAIFVDPRAVADGTGRTLFTFPDGSQVRLDGRRAVSYLDGSGSVVRSIDLPPSALSRGWMHLAVELAPGNRQATLLLDGFAYDTFTHDHPLFELVPGALVVGAAPQATGGGVRGWIDDFKILARRMDPEVACNHADGTLIGVIDNAAWSDIAAGYPAWAHAEVTTALASHGQATHPAYACFHDYSRDYGAHPGKVPAGTASVRRALHFPEGPLHADEPRPDSTRNAFCVTCHVPGAPAGLSPRALERHDEVSTANDPRRQPSQPLPLVHGNVPAHWIAPGTGPGGPDQDVVAPDAGIPVDPWVLAGG